MVVSLNSLLARITSYTHYVSHQFALDFLALVGLVFFVLFCISTTQTTLSQTKGCFWPIVFASILFVLAQICLNQALAIGKVGITMALMQQLSLV